MTCSLITESPSLNTQEKYNCWDFYSPLLVAGIILIRTMMISRYGINREAGGEFDAIFQILEGKLIYRDFFWYHGFLPLYLNAALFKLFSPEMLWLRLNVALFAALGGFFAYKVSRFFIPPIYSIIASLLSFSGLVTPLHVTGQLIAITLQIIAFYFLLEYAALSLHRSLIYSGIFTGVNFLVQIFPVGIVTLAGVIFSIVCFAIFDTKRRLSGLKYFLFGFIPFPLVSYGALTFLMPGEELYRNLFPMFSGYETLPTSYASFPIPPIFPVIHFGQQSGEIISVLNRYLFISFRWWLIILVFIWGLVEFFVAWKKDSHEKAPLLLLGALVLFCPLFESKFLIYIGRLGLTPSVINMLPTYILLLYLLSLRARFSIATITVCMLLVYFVYPFGRYYLYFANNAVPLGMPYSSGILVSPYKRDLYQNTHEYIIQKTQPEDLIVVAEINRYYSAFSGRKDLFQNNFLTFIQASFYPSRITSGFLKDSYSIEEKLVEKIKSSSVKLILIPEGYRAGGDAQKSPFLKFLGEHWEREAVFGDVKLINSFDWESPMEIYRPK